MKHFLDSGNQRNADGLYPLTADTIEGRFFWGFWDCFFRFEVPNLDTQEGKVEEGNCYISQIEKTVIFLSNKKHCLIEPEPV